MSAQPSVVDFVHDRLEQGMARGDILRQGIAAGFSGRDLGEALRARGFPLIPGDTGVQAPYSTGAGPRTSTGEDKGIPLDLNHAVRPYSS
ncbi:MAG: hypothetical protein AAB478_00260 [Patescibacteria group bacterium]